MKRSHVRQTISPSRVLLRVVTGLSIPNNALALDVGCGYGRNAVALAAYGWDVICVDRDLARLRQLEATKHTLLENLRVSRNAGRVTSLCADMTRHRWPFGPCSFHLIIGIHFVDPELFSSFATSLCDGGHLYIETFGGQGGNALELPSPGEMRAALAKQFNVTYYQEPAASARYPDAVAVKALARRL